MPTAGAKRYSLKLRRPPIVVCLSAPHRVIRILEDATMSLPPWKQAIIDRRKKQEEEQKKRQAEEDAYLASVPPWKRALLQKREKEKQQQQQSQRKNSEVKRNDSFLERQQELAKERKSHLEKKVHSSQTAQARSSVGQSGWGRATPPSPGVRGTTPPISPASTTAGVSHFSGTGSASLPSKARKTSITSLPTAADDLVARKIASTPIPNAVPSWRNKPVQEEKKVVSNVKKAYEGKTTRGKEIPAWKKALLQRKKEKGGAQESSRTPSPYEVDEPDGSTAYVKHARVHSNSPSPPPPIAGNPLVNDQANSEAVKLRRVSSPIDTSDSERSVQSVEDTAATLNFQNYPAQEPGRSISPTERGARTLPSEKTYTITAQLQKPKLNPLPIGRKPAPTELAGRVQTDSKPFTIKRKSSPIESMEPVTGQGSAPNYHGRPTPKRTAPLPPAGSWKQKQQQQKQQQSHQPAQTTHPKPKAVPDVINRSHSPDQNQLLKDEAVKRRAPVYKEVNKWSSVAEDDPTFLSLPLWKQALIKRRRADIAKRTGKTTSVDDVPDTKTPAPNKNGIIQATPRNPLTGRIETDASSVSHWKHQMNQKNKATQKLPNAVNNNKATKPAYTPQPHYVETGAPSNVKQLKNRFTNGSSTRVTSPVPTSDITQPPSTSHSYRPTHTVSGVPPTSTTTSRTKSYSWSLGESVSDEVISDDSSPSPTSDITQPPSTSHSSSRPTHTVSGVPPTSTTTSRTKSYSWSLGEGVSDEVISDDSSSEEDEEFVTNIDDISSEGESEHGDSDGSGRIVLLRSSRFLSAEPEEPKKSSILVNPQGRPQKVSQSSLSSLNIVVFVTLFITLTRHFPVS